MGAPFEPRVLDRAPVDSLDDYLADGGGDGLAAAAKLGPVATIEEVEASGVRGRGGAGFPTGRKWRTVAENASPALPATVVVNAAEGEPGSFKDRELLRRNPYRTLEGALIAAGAVGADRVVVALKASFRSEIERVRSAIAELRAAGWADAVDLDVLEGPEEYLFGEETGLLEVIEGRPPFPRIAPPFRHGAEEIGDGDESAADVVLAAPGQVSVAPPTLANNTETLAHVPGVLAHGPDWYRSVGTVESPGTVVCTVSGWTTRSAVGEVAMGTPLRAVIDDIGGGARRGQRIVAVLSGVANPLLPAARLDTPVSYEAMERAGTGLGAAGFMVFDDTVDLVAVAQGVARFLAVESCGQCTPCKQDGLAIAEILGRFCRSEATDEDLAALEDRLATVTDGARCYLAHQQERVMVSLLEHFPDVLAAHLDNAEHPVAVEPMLIAPLVNVDGGKATVEERHRAKQPDWTYNETDSGKVPAERLATPGAEPEEE
ncbi:MAG: NADH-ubiquinone oxidoreductase-F iron-sulfur binding region domain-containing protein [Acidimicrobiales bacterium]